MIMKYTFRRELPKADPKVIGGDANSSSFEILSPVLLNNKTRCMLAKRMGVTDTTLDHQIRCQNISSNHPIFSQDTDEIVLPRMYSGVYRLPSELGSSGTPTSLSTATNTLFGLNITLAGASSEALTAWSHTTTTTTAGAISGVPTLWWEVLTVPPVHFFQKNNNNNNKNNKNNDCDQIKNQLFNQHDKERGGIFFVVNSDKSLSSGGGSSILPQGGFSALYLILIAA